MKLDELRKRLRVPIHTITAEDAPTEKGRKLRDFVTEFLAKQAMVDDEQRAHGWPDCGVCGRPFSPYSLCIGEPSGVCSVCQSKHRGALK